MVEVTAQALGYGVVAIALAALGFGVWAPWSVASSCATVSMPLRSSWPRRACPGGPLQGRTYPFEPRKAAWPRGRNRRIGPSVSVTKPNPS